tara:strand:+ start:378 stop:560 length:183 start_codon:yes stop_codon:yes gene_type:complete
MIFRAFIVSIAVLTVPHSAAVAQTESYPKVSGELFVVGQDPDSLTLAAHDSRHSFAIPCH